MSLFEQLVAYWRGEAELDAEARRLCRDLSSELARVLPAEHLRNIQDYPDLYRPELEQAMRAFVLEEPTTREGKPLVLPATTGFPPRKEFTVPNPDVHSPVRSHGNVTQAAKGSGSVLMNGSSIGSLSVQNSGSSDARPKERSSPGGLARDRHTEKIRILFLGANPQDSTRLRLDAEVREIDRSLTSADLGARFELHQKWAVRPSELQMHLLRHRPHLLHFSGHGSKSNAIYLEGEDGRSRPVEGMRLARLLAQFNKNLRCVVLNACYSEEQAKAIAEHVDCVVGMSTAVLDQAAIRFAATFYQSLAFGSSVHDAFEMCCADIELGELGQDSVPQLLAVRQDPDGIVFAKPD